MGIYEETMQALEDAGTAQNRKVYTRHGVGGPQFGVSFAALKQLVKGRRGNLELAEQLWASGNHDARILATMIAPGKKVPESLLDAWACDLDSYVSADAFGKLVAGSPFAQAKHEQWKDEEREFVGQVSWNLLIHLASKAKDLDDAYFEKRLEEIEIEVHQRANRVRHSMNMALIAIGARSEALHAKAIAASERIGTLEVDHGETGCSTPDPVPYMEKMWVRQRAKEAKKSARG